MTEQRAGTVPGTNVAITAMARGEYIGLGDQAGLVVSVARMGAHRTAASDADQILEPHHASFYKKPMDEYDMQIFWSSGEWDFAVYLKKGSGLSRAAKLKAMKQAFRDTVAWSDSVLAGKALAKDYSDLEKRWDWISAHPN